MTRLTREWIWKAEADLRVAHREHAARRSVHDAVCFHCQQCAEKYLKGLLQEHSISFPKTHELADLIDLLLPAEPKLRQIRHVADGLTRYAVEYRYPGVLATRRNASSALKVAERVRAEVRCRLGLRLTIVRRNRS